MAQSTLNALVLTSYYINERAFLLTFDTKNSSYQETSNIWFTDLLTKHDCLLLLRFYNIKNFSQVIKEKVLLI